MRPPSRRPRADRTNFSPAAGFTEPILSNTGFGSAADWPRAKGLLCDGSLRDNENGQFAEPGVTESLSEPKRRKQSSTIFGAMIAIGYVAALLGADLGAGAAPTSAGKKEVGFQSNAPAAILVDAESDSILYEKNGDQPVAPASLAKLMTLEFLFNEIKQGRVKPEDEYIISENAW